MNRFKLQLITILFFSMPFGCITAQSWITLDKQGSDKEITTTVIKSDYSVYEVKVKIHRIADELVKNEYGEFHHLFMGGESSLSKVGEPKLPLFIQSIAIPYGATASFSINDEKWTDIVIGKIFPMQTPLLAKEKPKGFDIDEKVYQSNYIPILLNIGDEMKWRNISNRNVEVCPFRYYPSENRLSIMNEFTLQVNFAYGKKQLTETSHEFEDPFNLFDNLPYTDSTLQQHQSNFGIEKSMNSESYNYLIIVGDITGLYESDKLKEFQRWKALKGYKSKAVTKSTAGTNEAQIKSYIAQEYNKGVRYVLFIGSSSHIPLKEVYTARERYVSSDYWYGCLGGDDDLQAELPIGRFSVGSLSDFENMVDKTIKYESRYNSSNEVLLVAHMDGTEENFQGCCQNIWDAHINQMTFIPAFGYYDYARNEYVVGKINQGAHIVNYRGHGAPTSWGAWNSHNESFATNEIDSMNNETCAVFFSVACQTGNIKEQTCMLETFMRSDHGAVAFIGATEDTNNSVNHNYNKLLFNKLLDNGVYHLGDMNISAHIANDLTLSIYNKDNPFCYLCGGDPTLEIWTETPSTIMADVTIANGYATVSTNLSGSYYVSVVSDDGERLDSISCSSSVFTIPMIANKFYIAINKHNYYPRIIYFDSVSNSIVNMKFNNDTYYTATPINIYSEATLHDEDEGVVVKSGNKLVIMKGSGGVTIQKDFECENGAEFEIR